MGRFATTVPLYEKFRPPYPAEFFRTVSRVEEMLRDVEKRLLPLSNAGAVHEVVVSTAQVAR